MLCDVSSISALRPRFDNRLGAGRRLGEAERQPETGSVRLCHPSPIACGSSKSLFTASEDLLPPDFAGWSLWETYRL